MKDENLGVFQSRQGRARAEKRDAGGDSGVLTAVVSFLSFCCCKLQRSTSHL